MIRNEDICAEVLSGLPLYVGGDLEPAQSKELALHLEQCATCNEQARAAHEARALLVSALELSERRGPDLWPNVRAVLSENGLIRPQLQREIASSGAPVGERPFGASSLSQAPNARSWSTPRLLSYAAAAAAALIVGLWLGRSALQSPSGGVPVGGSETENMVTVPPNEGPAVLMGGGSTAGAPVVPVLDLGGLRPLRQGEVPLSRSAHSYFDSPWVDGWASNDPRQATAVGLRLVPRTQ